ncbi:MAG: hypothetical protein V3V92_06205 [Candidatus Hydrothermarchaeales archaeon]
MRIFSFLKFYLITVAFLFMFYSFVDMGIKRGFFLFIALTFLSPYIFKATLRFRGVRNGDLVLVSMQKKGTLGSLVEKSAGVALMNGKIGDVIEIKYANVRASGEILSYGGLIFPPDVGLLYYEKLAERWQDEVF